MTRRELFRRAAILALAPLPRVAEFTIGKSYGLAAWLPSPDDALFFGVERDFHTIRLDMVVTEIDAEAGVITVTTELP